MKLFNQSHFQKMPWKNGGGTTLELFSIRNKNGDILFRLSSAEVNQDGPFSIFPNIDRILFLLEGQGFQLTFPDKQIVMNQFLKPISFKGEEVIQCDLIGGACSDFNIMADRDYGKSSLSFRKLLFGDELTAMTTYLFIYLPNEKKLFQLEKNEVYNHDAHETQAFIVDLKLK